MPNYGINIAQVAVRNALVQIHTSIDTECRVPGKQVALWDI